MKRNHYKVSTTPRNSQGLIKRTAFHEAGHATAIYLFNKQKQLPPVFFQISIAGLIPNETVNDTKNCLSDNCLAKVEGGRLIHTLPVSDDDLFNNYTQKQADNDNTKTCYRDAFEADVVNLLIGPIAEAKFVALCDDEYFSADLINLDSLVYYGATSDLEIINEYFECFIPWEKLREKKSAELIATAFDFVNDELNWQTITALASYILQQKKDIITCEEVIAVIEQNLL